MIVTPNYDNDTEALRIISVPGEHEADRLRPVANCVTND